VVFPFVHSSSIHCATTWGVTLSEGSVFIPLSMGLYMYNGKRKSEGCGANFLEAVTVDCG
jgi:hypothetical protein